MTLVEWKPEFSLGIPAVDHEHRELIALINELHAGLETAAGRDSVIAFFGEIYARISAHFALEEAIMRERAYDQYGEHKAQHEDLLDQIRDIMDDFEAGAYDDYQDRLSSALAAWFTDHFKTHDSRLHRMLGDAHPWIGEI
ncbi:MAG TPA: bacteriohemerythrin [Alphaproteobacteria bacterium]